MQEADDRPVLWPNQQAPLEGVEPAPQGSKDVVSDDVDDDLEMEA